MQYKVKKEPRAAYIISAVTGLLAILFMYVGTAKIGNLLVNQIIMLLCGTVCVWVMVRYALTDYVYVLSDDAPYKLEIVKISGQVPKTLVVIDMSGKDYLLPLEKGEKIPEKIGKISKKENFCSNLFPKQRYLYVFEFDGKKVACKLEMDEGVAVFIQNRLENLRNTNQNGGNYEL